MRNKYKNKTISETKNKNEPNKALNTTVEESKDIKLKKMFLNKELTINKDNNNGITPKKININTLNSDCKLYKNFPIRKKLYHPAHDLISPKYKNNIHNYNKAKEKPSNTFQDNQTNKFVKNYKRVKNETKIKEDKNKCSTLNIIQVKKKDKENNNKNEDNNKNENYKYYNTELNKEKRIKNKTTFNYIKKNVDCNSGKGSLANKKQIIKNRHSYLQSDRITKSVEKGKDTENSSYIKTETNSNKFKLKHTFLSFLDKKEPKKEPNSKASDLNKKSNVKNEYYSYKKISSKIKKDYNSNDTNTNDLTKTINDNEIGKEKEKKRYIYINRKIRFNGNKKDNKDNELQAQNKENKKMEIEVENANSIKSPHQRIKKVRNSSNNNNDNYSLTDKKEEINKINSNINFKLVDKYYDKYYKSKKNYNNIKLFQSLKFLVHKVNETEALGDSFDQMYLSNPNSSRNSQNKKKVIYNISKNYNKLKTDFDTKDMNNTNNKYNMHNENILHFHSLIQDKKQLKNTTEQYNSGTKGINYANRIINNNTFNTTVNFFKINEIPSATNKNKNKYSSILKNSIIKKIKNKKRVEHKRTCSDNILLKHMLNKSQKKSNKDNLSENSDSVSSRNNIQYINTEIRDDNNKEYDLDLEVLYILEAKIKCLLNKINNYKKCYNECFDWILYYFSCHFYEKEINLFKLSHNKNNIIYYIKVELLCYFLCYDASFNKNFNQAGILLKTIFNLLHINYLILISFIIFENDNSLQNNNNKKDSLCLKELKNIINKELKIKFTSQDMNESCIIQFISNNFKEINNYYKMIIDNLYSYYYSINDDNNINKLINKFPNCLSLNVKTLSKIQKLNIISLFFFDTYRLTNNYNFEQLKNFFELYLYKSPENEALMPFDEVIINNIKSNLYHENNNQNNNDNYYFNNNIINDYYLPPIKSYFKYTLVLDLDETLVYCQKDDFLNNFYDNKNILILRPGLIDFLKKMKTIYELVLFSFGTKDYVDQILNVIEKKEKYFEYVLYRQHATFEKGDFVKNLALLGRDIKKIIIVDDIPHVFKLQKSNGICIKAFYGDIIDDRNTLKLLGKILEKIRFDADENEGDIRKSLKKQSNFIFTHITTNLEN